MSSSERSRRAVLFGLGALALGGCTFRPMYARVDVTGDGSASIGEQLARIDVTPIQSRTGVNLRNELLFKFTGGGRDVENPIHRLDIQMSETTTGVSIESIAGRPSGFNSIVTAVYVLSDVTTGRPVHRGRVVARASYERGIQRFADQRAERDAQDRAVRSMADLLRNELAAFFAGRMAT
jgi:LPS-assembly lipoprotein